MPLFSIIAGVILISIGVAGYFVGMSNDKASVTALIPAFIGLLLVVFGLVGQSKESLRKHMMHAAVLVALIGFVATASRLLPRLGEFTGSAAQLSQLSTALVCLAFVVFAIRSFIAARAARG